MGFNYQQPGKVKKADLAIFVGGAGRDRRAGDLGDLVAAMPDDLASLDFCYLTTTGRITGNPHRIEIWFALADETVFLMAGDRDRSDWVRNLMISPDVVLEIGDAQAHDARPGRRGRHRRGRARPAAACWRSTATATAATSARGAARRSSVAIDWPGGVSYTSLI